MDGVAKVAIGDRRLAWIWAHELTDWLGLLAWRWLRIAAVSEQIYSSMWYRVADLRPDLRPGVKISANTVIVDERST